MPECRFLSQGLKHPRGLRGLMTVLHLRRPCTIFITSYLAYAFVKQKKYMSIFLLDFASSSFFALTSVCLWCSARELTLCPTSSRFR